MPDNLQTTFDFDENMDANARLSPIRACGAHLPEGYKGFAGFHKYWGKKPIEAWRFLIEKLTDPNSIVLDPFLGSGLIARECVARDRRFIGFDVNPISIELTKLYLQAPDYMDLRNAICHIESRVKALIYSMYLLSDGSLVTHILWENDRITRVWTKRGRRRIELNPTKDEMERLQNVKMYEPRLLRELHLFDNSRINSQKTYDFTELFTSRALQAIDLIKAEIAQYSGDLKRALHLILSASVGQMSKMVFAISNREKNKDVEAKIDRLVDPLRDRGSIEVGSWAVGYWRPARHFEINAWNCYAIKAQKLLRAVGEAGLTKPLMISPTLRCFINRHQAAYIQQGDSEVLLKEIPTGAIRVVLTDPPHGDRIPYLELSEMWNGIIGLESNYEEELVVSDAKERGKDILAYKKKLASIFHECSRILEKNGVLAFMFNTRSTHYWDSLHELETTSSLVYLGCYPIAYSAGSILQDNRKGGLKTDFVLLYGKSMSEEYRSRVIDTFRITDGWTTCHPKEIC
jgi:hypothetical protein